jgi:outer membrane protein TolC
VRGVAVAAWSLPAWALLGASVPAVHAQEPSDVVADTGRPLEELVADLPGRAVTLDELLDVAMEWNLSLEASRVQRNLAGAEVTFERGLFDPGVSLEGALVRSRGLAEETGSYQARIDQVLPWGTELGVDLTGSRTPTATGAGVRYDADVGLSLRQPILEGFLARDAQLEVARRLNRASVHRLARAVESVTADVELAYWDLAEAEAIQAVFQRSYEIAEALLFRNRQLAERELVAEVDVITARSGVALRRATLVESRRNRMDAADALAFFVWGTEASVELAEDTLPLKTVPLELQVPAAGPRPQVEARALEARRDLAAARLELEGAREAARSAQNGLLPSLALEGAVRSGGTQPSLGGSLGALDQGVSWSLGFAFAQPLGNHRDRGTDRIADLTVELRSLELRIVENLVRQDVRVAVRGIQAGQERLEAAQEAAELARAQLQAERGRLDLGLGDSFRLLETEENAVQAELESVRARYDLARAVTRYRLAVGELGGG